MPAEPSVVRAFAALVGFSFRRQWRVRQTGWAALGLLLVLAGVVAVVTRGPAGWGLRNRTTRVADRTTPNASPMTYAAYADERLTMYEGFLGPWHQFGMKAALFAPMRAALADGAYLADWEFLNFSRWVVFVMYLGFLLPLLTLAYATGAIGAEREGRTLIWLFTRPMPRWAVYLAKLAGVLPWCVFAALLGLFALGAAGGPLGWKVAMAYWPAAVGGAVALAALFHLIGAVFRRPAVVGLVYVFFFETLVANLPGSLKQLSLNYYVRSLMYNEAKGVARTASPASLDVYAPADPATAWLVLLGAAVALTVLGMVLFERQEPTEEV
jgi:ABC-2 type transport system permease protein